MITCVQARLLLYYGAVPGTHRKGTPELGFHLTLCASCRMLWTAGKQELAPDHAVEQMGSVQELTANDKNTAARANLDQNLLVEQCSNHENSCQRDAEPPVALECTQDGELLFREAATVTAYNEPQPGASLPDQATVTYRSLLRNPNFRRLWIGQAISTFGSYFTRIAIPIYVFGLTNSYTQLGLAAFSSLVASLLFGLVAGALVDRWNPRPTMIAADLANGILVLVLVAIVAFPMPLPIQLGSVYVVNFLAALVREVFNPARVAIFADVVSESELLAANSLDQATATFAELVSYPLAALALFALGTLAAFVIDAITFFVSAFLLLGVRTRYTARKPIADTSIWSEIVEGIDAVREMPLVRMIVMLSLIVPLLISLFNTLQLPYVVEALGSTKDVGYPLIEGTMALGFACGVLALGRWGQHVPRSALLWNGMLVNGLAIILQGLVPILGKYASLSFVMPYNSSWTFLLFLALPFVWLTGAANSLIFTSIRTVLQEQTPREVLGRVASVVGTAGGLGFATGALLTGIGQGRVSMVLMVIGVVLVGIGLACRSWLPSGNSTVGPKYYSLPPQRS